MLAIEGLNVYDVLNYRELVMTSQTAKAIEARFAGEATAQPRGNQMSSPESLILAPIITEKGTMASEKAGQVLFRVRPGASKDKIREAVEHLFKVTVIKVRTSNFMGKERKKGAIKGRQRIGRRLT